MKAANVNADKGSSSSVRVAVRVRPQNFHEKAQNANVCVAVMEGEPQITIGPDKSFTYDYVFDQQTNQQTIYDKCAKELVEGTFEGYNATVLAYGQTGSGKTYTMGTNFDANQLQKDEETAGIIPRAAKHFFRSINEHKAKATEAGKPEPTFEVSVQFIELYNEELIDLLAKDKRNSANIVIREDPVRQAIYLRGVTTHQVQLPEDILIALKAGARKRTTASTNMNQQSSRSHAIFSICIKQTRVVPIETEAVPADAETPENDAGGKKGSNNGIGTELEVLHAKFHFVDLAGSERLNRTGATGERAREGISINGGLLALGNVISALGSAHGRLGHVPYRDSKLTRLLQDSLGGNSRTLMIACASPSEVDFYETLNSLNYANRAKNIKNKVTANQNKSSKLINELRSRIQELEEELNEYKSGKRVVGEDGVVQLNDQSTENTMLRKDNEALTRRVKALDSTIEVLQNEIVELRQSVEIAKIGDCMEELEELRIKLIEMQQTNSGVSIPSTTAVSLGSSTSAGQPPAVVSSSASSANASEGVIVTTASTTATTATASSTIGVTDQPTASASAGGQQWRFTGNASRRRHQYD